MKDLLILTAAYGEGHNAAARGLQAALARQPGVTARVWDPFAETYGAFYQYTRRNYLQTIERRPQLWSWTYRLLDRSPLIFVAARLLYKLRRTLQRALAEKPPDAIVSVYPIYPFLLESIFPPGRRPCRLYTVVTDSITINSVWHRRPSDLFFVANEATATVMKAAGVPPEKLRVTGFPVPLQFAEAPVARSAPELGAARVLYMINAGGGLAVPLVERLLRLKNLALTVTVGRDEALAAAVREAVRRAGGTAAVLGWVPNMPELLMSHHLLIGKAGGAAVQESIAARTPMIITHVVPGQEEGNAQLLLESGCGAVCETPEAIAAQVEQLFAEGAARWHQWEENVTRLSRPEGARRIAEAILGDLAGAP